ncbi:MAG: hypothetical protein Q8S26_09195 [Azonexus sp.]|nr:hypothetical protein [Azonexus sp.]
MTTQANVGFFKNEFVATLSDGRLIYQSDLHELADALHRAGILAKSVQYEWRSGQRMITAGQKVALLAAIRKQEHRPHGLAIAA